jgi:hypothetical protein
VRRSARVADHGEPLDTEGVGDLLDVACPVHDSPVRAAVARAVAAALQHNEPHPALPSGPREVPRPHVGRAAALRAVAVVLASALQTTGPDEPRACPRASGARSLPLGEAAALRAVSEMPERRPEQARPRPHRRRPLVKGAAVTRPASPRGRGSDSSEAIASLRIDSPWCFCLRLSDKPGAPRRAAVGISNEGPHSQQNATAEAGIAGNFAAVIGDFATAGPLPDSLASKQQHGFAGRHRAVPRR